MTVYTALLLGIGLWLFGLLFGRIVLRQDVGNYVRARKILYWITGGSKLSGIPGGYVNVQTAVFQVLGVLTLPAFLLSRLFSVPGPAQDLIALLIAGLGLIGVVRFAIRRERA